MIASFQTAALLTILIPVGILFAVLLYWAFVARRRDEF
jgi:hypothetical protein